MPALKIPIVITVIACFTLGTFLSIPAADPMPEFTILASTSVTDNTKVGKDYSAFLVDADKNEQQWWDWALRKLEADRGNKKIKVNDVFPKTIKKAFKTGDGSATSEYLNQVCKHLYKNQATNNITGTNSYESLAQGIFTYCSPLQGVPLTISKVANKEKTKAYKSKIGDTKKLSLIDTTTNNQFWTLKNKWFEAQAVNDAFFKPFKDDSKKSLLDACEAAYNTTTNTTASQTQPKEDDLTKYCGFKSS